MENIYDDANEFGLLYSQLRFYGAIILSIILIAYGLHRYNIDETHLEQISGTVLTAECHTYSSGYGKNLSISNRCALKISYKIDGVEHVKDMIVNEQMPLFKNDYIGLTYNRLTNEIKREGLSSRTIAYITFGSAFCILGYTYGTLYLAKRSKFFSSVSGTSAITNLFR